MYKTIFYAVLMLLFAACSSTESTVKERDEISIPEVNLLEIDYYSDSEIDSKTFSLEALTAMKGKFIYPEEARKKGLEGRVEVEALITTTGKAYITNLKASVHPSLDNMVMYAIKDTNFEPGTLNGKRVNVLTTIPIIFRLPQGPLNDFR